MSSAEPPPSTTVEVVDDVAGEFAERVVECFHYRPGERFRLALSSGDVAQRCYERLASHAETQLDWWLVEVFTAHPDLVRRALLDHVGAAHAVHLLASGPADDGPAPVSPPGRAPRGAAPPTRWPRLDLVHLDLAADGALIGPSLGTGADLILITACGADRGVALADLTGGSGPPLGTAGSGRLVVLADRAAGSAAPG